MKKMSKILSIILAISMVISMIPATFAAERENTKIVYDFIDNYTSDVPYENGENNFFTYKGINEVATYEKSNGFWKFDKMEGNLSVNHRYDGVDGTAYNNGLVAYTASTKRWYSINIRVPVSGSYEMSVYYQTNGSYDKEVRIYALPGTVSAEDVANTVSNGTGKVGSFDATKNASTDWKVRQNAIVGTVKLDAGENTLVFHSPNGKNFVVTTIELSSGNGSLVVPMSVTASANKTSLDATTAGDNAQISVSSVMYSDTTTKTEGITATDFVYTSSDTSLATVDASGKVTVAPTAVPGKVDISIAAKENPEFVLKTFSFDVVASKTTNTKIVYDFLKNFSDEVTTTTSESGFYAIHKDVNVVDSFEKSNGFWKFEAVEGNRTINHKYNPDVNWGNGLRAYFNENENWLALRIRVPESDVYSVKIGTNPNNEFEKECEFYIFDGETSVDQYQTKIDNKDGLLKVFDCSTGNDDSSNRIELGKKNMSAGEYIVLLHAKNGKEIRIFELSLTAGNGTNIIPMSAEISANDVEAGKTTAITLDKVHMSDATAATSASGITYESSDSNILTVSGTNATGVKAGTAKIYAKYNGEIIGETEVTVTNATVGKTVNVAIDDDGDGKATVKSATLGADVVAEAKDRSSEGLVFRGWVRGSEDNGRLVETAEKYTFKALTNIYLTAIYTDAPMGEVSEYYNWNGEFLGTTEPTDANAPTLLGYVFAKTWKDAGKVGTISRKIAEFNKQNTSYAITTDDSFSITNVDSEYDTEVTCTADNNVYWYRDDKLVDYGTNYTFFIWDATKVTTSNEGHDGAKIILDKNKSNSWMIEYDAGTVGKDNILEVGIVFGATGSTPTVEVCEEKMSSQRNDFTHGQFAATSDYPVARGYVIYKDGSDYKVIYAD